MAKLDKLLWGDRADPRDELRELFPSDERGSLAGARQWASEVVAAAGVSTDDELRVIKVLRDAEPRLSLKPARFLATQVAGAPRET